MPAWTWSSSFNVNTVAFGIRPLGLFGCPQDGAIPWGLRLQGLATGTTVDAGPDVFRRTPAAIAGCTRHCQWLHLFTENDAVLYVSLSGGEMIITHRANHRRSIARR